MGAVPSQTSWLQKCVCPLYCFSASSLQTAPGNAVLLYLPVLASSFCKILQSENSLCWNGPLEVIQSSLLLKAGLIRPGFLGTRPVESWRPPRMEIIWSIVSARWVHAWGHFLDLFRQFKENKLFCRQMLYDLGLKVLGLCVTEVRSSSTSDQHLFSSRPKNVPLPQVCQHMQQ